MSLKEDINYIKEEISTEESFMEKFFKTEQFYKKYKNTIIGGVSVIVIAIAGFYISSYLTEQNKIEANKAFNTLLTDSTNKEAIAILKENNLKLLEVINFTKNSTSNTDIEFLKELDLYSKAMKENNIDKISAVSQNQNFLLKDFAIFNKALIQTQNEKYLDAKETLKQIPESSDIVALSKMLAHFLITK
ncbi:MAG: hypothetical protein U9N59_10635 [Campylobacterota bacterium]|nr:hypothetical protein [Campylobacterota bacterium]